MYFLIGAGSSYNEIGVNIMKIDRTTSLVYLLQSAVRVKASYNRIDLAANIKAN